MKVPAVFTRGEFARNAKLLREELPILFVLSLNKIAPKQLDVEEIIADTAVGVRVLESGGVSLKYTSAKPSHSKGDQHESK